MKAYGCVAVVKGAGTLVADPDGEAYTNTTGNPGWRLPAAVMC